jgi:RNA polymerase sigma-70 factor (ECF subfamily)
MSNDRTNPCTGDDLQARISHIESQWTLLFRAHQSNADLRMEAQKQLLLRYYGAVYRYLMGIVRNTSAAEELTQDFAVRFLRGDFHTADRGRGRFRDFLKTALRHLAHDYWRKRGRAPRDMAGEPADQVGNEPAPDDALDRDFLDHWREELLARTWERVSAAETRTGQPYFTVLKRKTEEPGLRSALLADQLGKQLNKSFSEAAVRQILHRARELFADSLVDEIAQSLQTNDTDELEQELIDLDLLSYCQPALERRRAKPSRK